MIAIDVGQIWGEWNLSDDQGDHQGWPRLQLSVLHKITLLALLLMSSTSYFFNDVINTSH